MVCEDKRSMHRVHWVLKGQKDKLKHGFGNRWAIQYWTDVCQAQQYGSGNKIALIKKYIFWVIWPIFNKNFWACHELWHQTTINFVFCRNRTFFLQLLKMYLIPKSQMDFYTYIHIPKVRSTNYRCYHGYRTCSNLNRGFLQARSC